jgi:hypothetical protein
MSQIAINQELGVRLRSAVDAEPRPDETVAQPGRFRWSHGMPEFESERSSSVLSRALRQIVQTPVEDRTPQAAAPAVLRSGSGDVHREGDGRSAHAETADLDERMPLSSDSDFDASRRTPASDRRRFPRRSSECHVRLMPRSERTVSVKDMQWALHATPYRGRVLDISMSGAAFVLNHPITPSAAVWLRLENRARDFSTTVPARVIDTAQLADSAWKVMCSFDHCLALGDVLQLGNQML